MESGSKRKVIIPCPVEHCAGRLMDDGEGYGLDGKKGLACTLCSRGFRVSREIMEREQLQFQTSMEPLLVLAR